MSSSIISPFPVFNDLNGGALNGGHIFIGAVNLNPEVAPINVYWDKALTIPAPQPLRTIGGFISRSGSPANVYVEEDSYSITVRNKNYGFLYSSVEQPSQVVPFPVTQSELIIATQGQTIFNFLLLRYVVGQNSLQVFRNGIRLIIGIDYTESSSTQITLTALPDAGDEFWFTKFLYSNFIQIQANAGQTLFVIPTFAYNQGTNELTVYRNGLLLNVQSDYTESGPTTISLISPAEEGDQFSFYSIIDYTKYKILNETIVAVSLQVIFNLTTFAYKPGSQRLHVYRNGMRLIESLDYVETTQTIITLISPAEASDEFVFLSFENK
jgi:hypothetical protein